MANFLFNEMNVPYFCFLFNILYFHGTKLCIRYNPYLFTTFHKLNAFEHGLVSF